MGCNCKQKKKSEPVIINEDRSVQLTEPHKPNCTREELDRVFSFINSRSQTLEEKKWVINYHNTHFPEQLSLNCADCWVRLRQRMEHLNKQLYTYEQYEKTRRETTENIA